MSTKSFHAITPESLEAVAARGLGTTVGYSNATGQRYAPNAVESIPPNHAFDREEGGAMKTHILLTINPRNEHECGECKGPLNDGECECCEPRMMCGGALLEASSKTWMRGPLCLAAERKARELVKLLRTMEQQRDHWRKQVDDLLGALEAVTQDLRETEQALAVEVDLRFRTQHERDEARKSGDYRERDAMRMVHEQQEEITKLQNEVKDLRAQLRDGAAGR